MESQFHLYENDREEKIEIFQPEDSPSTIGLLIDNSGSMLDKRSDVVKMALAFIAASHPQNENFIVNFNRNAWLALPSSHAFTSDWLQLRATLTQTRAEGTTALYDAISLALNHLEKNTRRRTALLVVSDGADNASLAHFDEVLRLAQQSSATIYCVGIYDAAQRDRDPAALKAIASATGGEAFFPDSLANLHSISPQIAAAIRGQYMLGYVPSNPTRLGGYRKINVTASDEDGRLLHVQARPGYVARGSIA